MVRKVMLSVLGLGLLWGLLGPTTGDLASPLVPKAQARPPKVDKKLLRYKEREAKHKIRNVERHERREKHREAHLKNEVKTIKKHLGKNRGRNRGRK